MTAADLYLGKAQPTHDPRTLVLGKYTPNIPLPPAAVQPPSNVQDWGVMKNDAEGDCAFAAQGHIAMLWTDVADGTPVSISDSTIEKAYSKCTGFDPSQTDANGNNPTDQGTVLLDALNQWRHYGLANRHRIYAYAAMDVHDAVQAQQTMWLTNTAYIGVALPVTVQDQFDNDQIWDVVQNAGTAGNPGSWGGHCICLAGYDQRGPFAISWGRLVQMTWRFWSAYVDEAYAVIGTDELSQNRHTSLGLNLSQLDADLNVIAKG